MNITVNIQAPELSNAILALAAALSAQAPNSVPVAPPVQQQMHQAPPVQNVPPAQQQYQQAPMAPPQSVPTSAPAYSMDQLAVAATQLMDANRQSDLLGLLASFGVQSLMQLPQEQYGAFATKLRELGAQI